MGETLSRFSENILEGRTRLIFDTKAFMGECRLFTARRSVIIITERDICFSPTVQWCLSLSFSSRCTHRGRISIPPTPGENRADIKAETFRVSRAGTPVKRAQPTNQAQGHKCGRRTICTVARKHNQIERCPALPSVVCRSLGGVVVSCGAVPQLGDNRKRKTEQHGRCSGCFWVSSCTSSSREDRHVLSWHAV